MRRRKRNKRSIQIVIGSGLCILLIMTVGYAAFSTNITLSAKGNIKEIYHTVTFKNNLVHNSTLENLDYWEFNNSAGDTGSIALDTTLKYEGYNSIRIYDKGSFDFQGIRSKDYEFSYKPNTKYQQSAYVYRDSTSTYGDMVNQFRMYLPRVKNYTGGTGASNVCDYNHNVTLTNTNLPDRTWQKSEFTFVTPIIGVSECNIFEKWRMDFHINGNMKTSNVWIALPSFYEVTEKQIKKFNKIGELPTAEKEGYTFEGWFTEEYGGEKISDLTKITEDTSFYAHFTKK